MKNSLDILRAVLLVAVLAIFAVATPGVAEEIEEGGGSCQKPKDSQCLYNHPALGDWTPALQ